MGRPRKKDDISAPVKIENAFWQLLGIESYSNMTIQKLADAAGVNRNAVYYHYENVDDVAKNALHNFLQKDIVDGFIRQMIGGVGKDSFMKIDEAYMPEIRRIQLCASSDSKYLNQILKDAIKDKWFDKLKIDESKIYETEKLSIEFALSGIVAVLGSEAVANNPLLMLKMPETDMGKAAVKTLLKLAGDVKQR